MPPWMWVAVALTGLALRVFGLDGIPLTNDEQHYVATSLAAEEFASLRAVRDVLTAGWIEGRARHPLLYQLANRYLIFPLFGDGFAAMRLLNALAGSATVLLTGALARGIGARPRQALASAAILAIMPFHIRFSRSAYLDPFFAMWIVAAFASAAFAIRRNSTALCAVTGVLAGCMASTKISAPLFLLALPIFCLVVARGGRVSARRMAMPAAAACVAFAAVFLALNDPAEYAAAILFRDSSDAKYAGTAGEWLGATLFSGRFWALLGGLVLLLLPVTLVPAVVEAFRSGEWPQASLAPVAVLLLPCLPLLALHAPAFSGEHGLLPLAVVLALLAGRGCVGSDGRATFAGLLYFATAPVPAFLWGLNFGPLPYQPYYNPVRGYDPEYEAIRLLRAHAPEGSTTAIDYVTEDGLRHLILGAPGPVLGFDLHANPDAFRSDALRWCDYILLVGEDSSLRGVVNLESVAAKVVGPNTVELLAVGGGRLPVGVPPLSTGTAADGLPVLRGPDWCLFLSAFATPVLGGKEMGVALERDVAGPNVWRAPTPRLEMHFPASTSVADLGGATLELESPHPWFVFGRGAYVRLRKEYLPESRAGGRP